MKKIVLLLLVVLPSFIFAQSTFDKFEDKDEVNSVIVNKKMFELMSKVKIDAKDKEMQQYLTLLKKLDNLKVFTTNSTKLSSEMKSSVSSYLKSNPLEELMRVNSDGKNVKIYIKSAGSTSIVKELLLFMEGDLKDTPTVILSLTGEFNLDELSSLTERMNLPGKDELKKASKK
ncbi:DUF4252 domain-containing protein [uncultured Flavobacterium sp.]|uniref:DUF4252 domain-containing protein n=1 Tax=uncultured Flavobacterium sp. TaxID=165435 RepID=UPI0030EC0EF7|tara:strand:- start:63 stop:584 length:522 start_codon:yes stop_codon:yes gene_type:complete